MNGHPVGRMKEQGEGKGYIETRLTGNRDEIDKRVGDMSLRGWYLVGIHAMPSTTGWHQGDRVIAIMRKSNREQPGEAKGEHRYLAYQAYWDYKNEDMNTQFICSKCRRVANIPPDLLSECKPLGDPADPRTVWDISKTRMYDNSPCMGNSGNTISK